ncbi:centrosomal protein of 63 kDa isoform X2 [Narcine bancroftii]|uniref:centrosomal protein of 63 kDa isoform X2 n=1 Tax=Narcine bancroftii TaxID=1343680 RepID=UPI00383144A8
MEALLEAVKSVGQDSNVLTTCEAELQELMKQIDIMVAHKKSEWEVQFQSVQNRLKVREQELGAFRLLLDQKQAEVGQLHQQLKDSDKTQHDMVRQYESQLIMFQQEIDKLKKSYEKLQRRQLKEEREKKDKQGRTEGMSELSRLSKKVEKSMEENEELKKKLQEQEYLIQSKDLQQKQLSKELARCNELLLAREKATSSQTELQREVTLQTSPQSEKNLMDEVTVLKQSLDSANENVLKKQEELKQMEEENSKCKLDVKKLRDQLNLVEQQHCSELKGMKLEISQLTSDLHQRDVLIATMRAATSNVERQLRSELEKTNRTAKEMKVTQIQYETLKLENQYLAGILKGERQNRSLMDLRDGYFSSMKQLEQENHRLQQELADMRNKLEMSVKVSQERYELLLDQIQNKLTDIRVVEDRRVEELRLEHKEELQELQKRLRETQSQHSLTRLDFKNATDSPSQASRVHQEEPCDVSPSASLCGITPCTGLPADGNEAGFSDSASVQSFRSLCYDQLLPSSPTVESPNTSIAARFIEEEDKRTQQLLRQLDMHIEELKVESERTVDKYV